MRDTFLRRSRHRLVALPGTAALALAGAVALPGTAQAATIPSNPYGLRVRPHPLVVRRRSRFGRLSPPVHSGSRALAGAVSSSGIAKCGQGVTVQPNTTYALTGWVRGSCACLGVNGGASAWTSSPSAYSRLSLSFTTGATQTRATVHVHGWYAQGTYYADDISLDGPGGGDDPDGQAPAAPGTSYTFTVRARDAAGNTSAASGSVSVTRDQDTGGRTGFKQAAPHLCLGWDDATAYAHVDVSGMNGLSDRQELTSAGAWTQIRAWANSRHIARLALWSVNRDRPCPGGGTSNCSGISRNNWRFTSITAGSPAERRRGAPRTSRGAPRPRNRLALPAGPAT